MASSSASAAGLVNLSWLTLALWAPHALYTCHCASTGIEDQNILERILRPCSRFDLIEQSFKLRSILPRQHGSPRREPMLHRVEPRPIPTLLLFDTADTLRFHLHCSGKKA